MKALDMIKALGKKKLIIIGSIVLALILVLVIVLIKNADHNPYGEEASSVIDDKEVVEVTELLRAAELSNVDLFETWVYEYLEDKDKNYQSDAYSDADCRMTAMLLFDDQISCKDAEEYKGDYLAIDVDKIENEGTYTFIRDNLSVFTTLFGETKIPKDGIEQALPQNWKKHGIKVFNDKASLVSLVFKSMDKEEVFVGHAAVLVDCSKLSGSEKKNYLLVEKLGFNDAFMATILEDPKDMIDLFSKRPEYKEEAGAQKPLLYVNDKLLGELR